MIAARAATWIVLAAALLAGPAADRAAAGSGTPTMRDVIARLDRALTLLDAADVRGAAAEMKAFQSDWVEVEGLVKTRSPQAYTDIENDMALASALLTSTPPDVARARGVIESLRTELTPFADASSYGVFDAAIILLREGLEALLVVAALLTFLTKTGNAAKAGWVWAGGAAGVGLSVAVALIVNLVFAQTGGANRELIEGVVGLFAAAMLLYMSYWLHSKASLGTWQRYIRERSSAALARNSLLSLALISFLAVFREGAETVLFYLGIAPSIAVGDLALGLALGAGGLAVVGVAMLAFGVRLPIRPFFLIAGLLVYYLAFKFIGTGVHALQVAGAVPVTPGPIPESSFFGLYPTWQTTAPQLALLVLAGAVLLRGRIAAPRGPNVTGGAPA